MNGCAGSSSVLGDGTAALAGNGASLTVVGGSGASSQGGDGLKGGVTSSLEDSLNVEEVSLDSNEAEGGQNDELVHG